MNHTNITNFSSESLSPSSDEAKFPSDFVWGAATSSYQIEGAVTEDGKGAHIWDVFTREEGRIFENHTGEIACDHYHRFKDDVKLMKEIGIRAYRFSIDWSRVLPNGFGTVNEKGIAFYNALIDELLKNDIEPYVTLYHWELPYELYKRGGWLNPQIVEWFGDYARLVAERFSDRVKNIWHLLWHNLPQLSGHPHFRQMPLALPSCARSWTGYRG